MPYVQNWYPIREPTLLLYDKLVRGIFTVAPVREPIFMVRTKGIAGGITTSLGEHIE